MNDSERLRGIEVKEISLGKVTRAGSLRNEFYFGSYLEDSPKSRMFGRTVDHGGPMFITHDEPTDLLLGGGAYIATIYLLYDRFCVRNGGNEYVHRVYLLSNTHNQGSGINK